MIDISPDLRRRIKIAAAQRDMTIRQYVEQQLEQLVQVEMDTKPRAEKTAELLEDLRRFRESMSQGRVLSDSVEIIHQMREERTKQLMGEE